MNKIKHPNQTQNNSQQSRQNNNNSNTINNTMDNYNRWTIKSKVSTTTKMVGATQTSDPIGLGEAWSTRYINLCHIIMRKPANNNAGTGRRVYNNTPPYSLDISEWLNTSNKTHGEGKCQASMINIDEYKHTIRQCNILNQTQRPEHQSGGNDKSQTRLIWFPQSKTNK